MKKIEKKERIVLNDNKLINQLIVNSWLKRRGCPSLDTQLNWIGNPKRQLDGWLNCVTLVINYRENSSASYLRSTKKNLAHTFCRKSNRNQYHLPHKWITTRWLLVDLLVHSRVIVTKRKFDRIFFDSIAVINQVGSFTYFNSNV